MSKLSRNIIANLSGRGLLLILGFVAVKYVFKRWGEDALGIIFFTQTLSVMLCAILEMGIGSTTARQVSAHLRDEPKHIRDFIQTGALLFWGACGLLAVTIYAAAPLLVPPAKDCSADIVF